MDEVYPKLVGQVDIPTDYNVAKQNKARRSREILNELPQNGKANAYEFTDHKEADNYRAMLYSMAILKWGEAGHIGAHLTDNILFIWQINK